MQSKNKSKNKNKSGRPVLPPEKKKTHRIQFYLNDDEYKKLQSLHIALLKHSPTLSLSEFFRLIVLNFDDTIIDYLQESYDSDVKTYMRNKCAYNTIFN